MFNKSLYNNILKFIKPYKRKISLIIILKLIVLTCVVSVPYLLGRVITSLENNSTNLTFLMRYLLILITIYLVWNITSVLLEVLFEKVNKSIENDIRTYCYETIINSKMIKIQDKEDGEIISKVIRDTERIEKIFSSMITFIDLLLHTIVTIVVMLLINLQLSLIVLSIFILIGIFQRIMSKPLKKYYKLYKNSEENLLKEIKNYLANFFTVKVLSLESRSVSILKNKNQENLKNHMKIKIVSSIIKNISFFLSSLFRISSLIVGGILHIYNRISIGSIFSLYSYSIQLSNRLMRLIEIDILLKDIETSFSRISDFLNHFETNLNSSSLSDIDKIKKIEFKNVTFIRQKKRLLNNISFVAKSGDVIGIRGGNGTGKTTLTYLICGFFKVDNVFMNDANINKFSEAGILNRISYVLQDVKLFKGSIIDNLTCFGRVEKKEAYQVSKAIGLHKKVIKLKHSYETIVNEKNLNLSGGEKQLISLAQSILKDSDVLILDEMNSALDSKTEETLLSNIKQYYHNKIVFIISHKNKVFDMCDVIIDLDKQQVISKSKTNNNSFCAADKL
ncbi:ABC transporter ATP-binding protein [Clostridium sp. 'deep sea']|uniref:ABC transporter ATP-binding protein n=1 Tax=Clostridium sp. 'deep sea' TaxID=2779445 RepID=UPI0018963EBF|nr:ABC transporter ATP-binding protein [Clostridium sp. 'deep sea']QOR33669.1 ABC transporter ATP-binding protein [Clostridium sp. 'deep sea']